MQNSWSQIIRTSFSAGLAAKIAFVTLSMRMKWYLLIHGVYQKGSSVPFPSIMFLADPQQGPEWAQKKKVRMAKEKDICPSCLTVLPASFPLPVVCFTWPGVAWLYRCGCRKAQQKLVVLIFLRHLDSDGRASHFPTLFPTILCGCC